MRILYLFIRIFKSKLVFSSNFIRFFLNFFEFFLRLFRLKYQAIDTERLIRSITVPLSRGKYKSSDLLSFEIICVVTSKDFDILKNCLSFATLALKDYQLNKISIVVPENEVTQCKEMLTNFVFLEKCNVINENEVISSNLRKLLKSVFNERYGWVLQQLLKFKMAQDSEAFAVLVVDADTILLDKRPWIDSDRNQILTPVEEYNSDYYLFLNKLKLCDLEPEFTFVSHHMIIQPELLKRILNKSEIYSFENLCELIIKHSNRGTNSPICIDYEFYAQGMQLHYPDKVILSKWANIGLPRKFALNILRNRFLISFLRRTYFSISFHSWS